MEIVGGIAQVAVGEHAAITRPQKHVLEAGVRHRAPIIG